MSQIFRCVKGFGVAIFGIAILIGTYSLLDRLVSNLTSHRQTVVVESDGAVETINYQGGVTHDELSTWLTLFGVFASFFGLFIPIVTYFLQLRTLARERDELRNEIQSSVERAKTSIKTEVDDVTRRLWLGLSVPIQWQLIQYVLSDARSIANFLIGFDHALEAAARSEDKVLLYGLVDGFKDPIEEMMKRQEWNAAVKMLSMSFRPDSRFLKGKCYADLLGGSSEQYKFLKRLFDSFAPWKFVE